MAVIEKFELHIKDDQLTDLKRRLEMTRWPDAETVDDWSQGVPLREMQWLCEYWRTDYDWRRCEAKLNAYGQFRTEIDGLGIHFLYIRSPEPDALPLLMTHGWPGSVLEFHKVIGPLSNPAAHGGDRKDAFHLVLPTLPGYGFSDKPARTGWGTERIAEAWIELMKRLGYKRFVAQGGDWGAVVTRALASMRPPECAAVHMNMFLAFPDEGEEPTPEEATAIAAFEQFTDRESSYAKQQNTRPQTLGYGLADSPVLQAAWIFEKFRAWTDCGGDPFSILTRDEILDDIMLYWLPCAGTSSGRLYWESMDTSFNFPKTDMPAGFSLFPKEIFRPSKRLFNKNFTNTIYWNELDKGGHFAALEQPELFTSEVRNCFRSFH